MTRLALLLATPLLLAAATPTVVTWSAATVRATTRAPGQGLIRVKGNIIPRWHVYSVSQKPGGPKPLSFALEGAPGFSIGAPRGPKPEQALDAQFRMTTETYSGAPEFAIPIRWTRPLGAGTTRVRLIIRYQACSDKLCLPPRKETLAVEIRGTATR